VAQHSPLTSTERQLYAAQAAYYVATGVWPLAHRRSFEAVTGPKSDFWLVQTVGVLVTAIGGGIAVAFRRPAPSLELRVVAALAAAGLAAVDIYFVGRRRIRPVYLADAAIELLFVAPSLTRSGAHLRSVACLIASRSESRRQYRGFLTLTQPRSPDR
jgi:hypothetical protein